MYLGELSRVELLYKKTFKLLIHFRQGLGKSSQGRVEPVEIVILPPGKSLDVCAEMRERKELRGVDTERQRKRRRKKEKEAEAKAAEEGQETDMFDFLNTKIFNKSELLLEWLRLVVVTRSSLSSELKW